MRAPILKADLIDLMATYAAQTSKHDAAFWAKHYDRTYTAVELYMLVDAHTHPDYETGQLLHKQVVEARLTRLDGR